MPFCFKRKEATQKAVRRICCERLDAALKCIRQPDHLEGVHAARKEIKKLRAVLRLLRGEIRKKDHQKITEELRAAANRLAAMRDAHVKLNASMELTKHFRRELPANPFPEIKNALRRNCVEQEKRFLGGNSIAAVTATLQRLKICAGKLQLESNGWAAISSGLKKSYRRGRKAFKVARRNSRTENFHEWRKRMKDLWHHLRLLRPACPKKMRARADDLESLGNFLGDDHDFFLLAEFIGKEFRRAGEQLKKLVTRRQKELRAAALKAGREFYSERPKAFCARIGNAWKHWRK